MIIDVTVSNMNGKTVYIVIDGKRRLGRLKSGERYVAQGSGSLAFYGIQQAALALDLTSELEGRHDFGR